MESVSMIKKVHEAMKKFEAEFEFSKMETMIHRFPAGLGDGMSTRYPHMVVPRFVAIGPYHHGKKHLEKMEEVKNAAAYYLCQRIGVSAEEARQAVLAVADEARGMYYYYDMAHDDETAAVVEGEVAAAGTMKWKDHFAAMMLRDACFLLLYMDAYNRSYGEKEDYVVNKSMRRFLFSNRDSINGDIMLLENQLPWLVIQALLRVVSQEHKRDLHRAVGKFVAGMGNSFMIVESSQLVPYVWDDEKNPPAHLLALLRRHKTESAANAVVLQLYGDGNASNHVPAPATPSTLHHPLILPSASTPPPPSASPTTTTTREGKRPPAVTSISSMSPANLEEIGIQLTASRTAAFSDMGLEKGWLWSRLTLAPLSLSDTRASCLVNMAALEVCAASRFGDHSDRTAVCSYLALLAFFMVRKKDVRRLRSMGLLHGPHGDDDMLAFFNAVAKHLPSCGKHFAFLMAEIEEYKQNRRIRTTLYRWVHNNWKTIGTVGSIIIALVSTIAALIGFYQALLSLVHNN